MCCAANIFGRHGRASHRILEDVENDFVVPLAIKREPDLKKILFQHMVQSAG
jgi:hypothetical protein